MDQAYHLSETNSKQNLSPDGHLEYQGIKYRHCFGVSVVKNEEPHSTSRRRLCQVTG